MLVYRVSIPLQLATGGDALVKATKGALVDPISTSQTIFSYWNLIIVAVNLVHITVC